MVIRILFFLLLCTSLQAQNNRIFRIYFTDKNNSPFSLSQPEGFLSQKAIQRRVDAGIPILLNDIPIVQAYIDSVLTYPNVILKSKSKWFNTIAIETDSSTLIQLLNLSFISGAERLKSRVIRSEEEKWAVTAENRFFETVGENYYGLAFNQIQMLNGHYLHQQGYRGAGITIAVLDAGFPVMNEMPAFARLFSGNRVLGTYDFVQDTTDVFTNSHFHGSLVMSCMGAEDPFLFAGTAPDASYYFFITEDADSELPIEEDNWVEAAEMADSAGADLINTSLGYTTFDDSTLNHTYADLDGNTTFISRGADVAASKGILVVCSAGNSGSSAWFHIGAPGDADSVLTVGAVNGDGSYADFSSKGNASDGDLKPNVAAQGSAAALIWPGGNISSGSGTSFSAPITCGMAACLWQAHPDKNNMQIIGAIQNSASHYLTPDSLTGYGIPDFWKAHQLLSGTDTDFSSEADLLAVYPNPFSRNLWIEIYPEKSTQALIQFCDLAGRIIFEKSVLVTGEVKNQIEIFEAVNRVAPGIYLVKISTGQFSETVKIEYLPE